VSFLRRFLIALLPAWLAAAPVLGGDAVPAASDPVLEKRLMELAHELRCLVCQNQSLAESDAELAVDLRRELREQMREGRSDAEIRAWLRARYGDFVLYRPPLSAGTLLLWVGPFALAAGGLIGLAWYLRARRTHLEQRALTPEEQRRARELLGVSVTERAP
jgi:cytochrome c-type biogenesis protein CcmH